MSERVLGVEGDGACVQVCAYVRTDALCMSAVAGETVAD